MYSRCASFARSLCVRVCTSRTYSRLRCAPSPTVSDFGMSAALAGGADESDYAANYVKLGGEVRPTPCYMITVPTFRPSFPPHSTPLAADVQKNTRVSRTNVHACVHRDERRAHHVIFNPTSSHACLSLHGAQFASRLLLTVPNWSTAPRALELNRGAGVGQVLQGISKCTAHCPFHALDPCADSMRIGRVHIRTCGHLVSSSLK
jgi:hypothetical protein